MKKGFLFGIAVLPALCHAQSNATQLPNGVVVHQAQGVENTTVPVKNEPVKIRTIQDWNLSECMDALAHTEMKLKDASDVDRERYLNGKALIVKRISELKSIR